MTKTPATVEEKEAAEDAAAAALFAEFAAAKAPAPNPGDAVVETPETVEEPEPTSAAAPAAAAPTAPTGTPAAPAQSDIWANATPEQKAAYEAAQSWQQKYNSDLGRNRAYQARIGELTAENADLKAKITPPAAPASSAAPAAPAKPTTLREDPRYKQLLDDYPDLMGPVVDAIERLHAETDEIKGSMKGLTQDLSERTLAQNEAKLTKAIPEWKELTAKPEFFEWLGGRNPDTQAKAARNGEAIVNPEEAIELIGDYRAHALAQGKLTPPQPVAPAAPTNLDERRKAQLAASKAAPSRSPNTPPDGPSGDNGDALFNHFVSVKARKA